MNFAMGKDNDNSNNNNKSSSSSLILTAKYGHESSKLIRLIEKNLSIVIGLIIFMTVLSIINTLGFHYLLAYSEDVDFIVDIALSIILVIAIIPLLILLFKSRNTLDRWNGMFEVNTLSVSLSIAMASRTKEETLKAIIQSVEQISMPLNDYVTQRKSDLKEFQNVYVDKNTLFDILIDADHVLNGENNKDNSLRNVLREYGAIIVKIIDGRVDDTSVESFVNSLLRYVSITKNKLGLVIIIGEEISPDARKYTHHLLYKHRNRGTGRSSSSRKISNLILIEKPSSPSPPPGSSQDVIVPK
jgi:hypothetical protein